MCVCVREDGNKFGIPDSMIIFQSIICVIFKAILLSLLEQGNAWIIYLFLFFGAYWNKKK